MPILFFAAFSLWISNLFAQDGRIYIRDSPQAVRHIYDSLMETRNQASQLNQDNVDFINIQRERFHNSFSVQELEEQFRGQMKQVISDIDVGTIRLSTRTFMKLSVWSYVYKNHIRSVIHIQAHTNKNIIRELESFFKESVRDFSVGRTGNVYTITMVVESVNLPDLKEALPAFMAGYGGLLEISKSSLHLRARNSFSLTCTGYFY